MSLTTNTDFSTILSQIQGITAQGVNGGSSLGGLSFDDIWSANAYFEQLSNGNGEQKAQAAQGLIQKALSLINTFQAQRSSEAKSAEKETDSKTQKAQNDQNKTEAEIKQDTDSVNADAENNQSDIDAAQKKQEDVAEQQKDEAKKIEESSQKIGEKQAKLKSADTPQEQERVLGEVPEINDELGEASGTLQELEGDANAVQESLETADAAAAEIQTRGAEVTANGQQKLAATTSKYGEVAGKAGERSAKSIEDKVVEKAAEQLANASSVIPPAATVQASARKTAVDAGRSANINSGTAVKAGSAVAKAAPELVTDVHQLSDYAFNLVGAMNQQNDLIGAANAKISPIISGIGQQIDSTSSVNKTVGSAVENDLAQVQAKQAAEQAQPTQQGEGGASQEGAAQPTQTENVDTSALKQKVPEN